MSFLHKRRSLQAFHVKEKDSKLAPATPPPLIPSPAAIENVPQKRSRYRTTSSIGASRIIRRVSSIFTPRKKAPPDLKLVNSALDNIPTPRSYSSSKESLESEDDIRRPSGLGSAVSISSLPPSPFSPQHPPEVKNPSVYHTFPSGEFQRTRAISSPNLLRSLSWKVRGKARARHASIVPTPASSTTPEPPPPVPPLSPKPTVQIPEEIIVLILSHLPQSNVGLLATVSRTFVSAARKALYTTLDVDPLAPLQLEKLVALLASRWELTDLVMTFICRKWPSFFLPDTTHPDALQTDHVIQHKNALLTASFTLALERMSNLHSLTLPSFDYSLLSHHTAFGLKCLTFLNHTTSDAETRALFTWLDGQTNITSLKFTNLEDTPTSTKLSISLDIPLHDNTKPGTAPSSPHLKPFPTNGLLSPYASPSSSPRSACFQRPPSPPTPVILFASSSLLPNLTTLHATPALLMLLTPPLETASRRPLKSVMLNINTTLYNGLRPASLMSSLRGVEHLVLRFSENVDRRSFEKVLGAAGAALGVPNKKAMDDPFVDAQSPTEVRWLGLHSLEISFHTITQATAQPLRDEALYKSLQASLPRYKALSSLHFLVCSADDAQGDVEKDKKDDTPSAPEQILINSWVKLCPTLESIVLFSGARWQQVAQPQSTRPPPSAQPQFEQQQQPAQLQKRRSTTAYGGTEFKFP